MHFSFEEDVSTEELESALKTIPMLLKRIGITRLSYLTLNGLAWQNTSRLELGSTDGVSSFINVASVPDTSSPSGVRWEASIRDGNSYPDD